MQTASFGEGWQPFPNSASYARIQVEILLMFGTMSSADDAGELLARPSVKCVNYYAALVVLFASTPHDRLIIEYRLHTHIMKSFPSLNQRILHSVAHTLSVCRFMLQLDRIYFANVFLYVAYVRAHCKPCCGVFAVLRVRTLRYPSVSIRSVVRVRVSRKC